MVDKHYTIKDIAREAGVSPALVSFALNNRGANGEMRYKVNKDTARRILEIAKAHNYKPNNAARSLRSRKSHTIGIILSIGILIFYGDDAVLAQVVDIHRSHIISEDIIVDIDGGIWVTKIRGDGIVYKVMGSTCQIDTIGGAVTNLCIDHLGIDILQDQTIDGMVVNTRILEG